jgi:sarcosine oxidase
MAASSSTYDAIVVGVGGMGSAALYHLSRRGAKRVLGLEQFDVTNDKGSSHGREASMPGRRNHRR